MLVDNYKNQLKEALRVTQSGSYFGFVVWGRRENAQIFSILNQILAKHGLGPKEPPKKSPFDLSQNPEALKLEMESLGFSKVHMWYQTQNFKFKNAE